MAVPLPSVAWQAPPVEKVSASLPQFEVLSLLGRGGMGAVYKAKQRSLDRIVAVKLLPVEIGEDECFRRRFFREARILAHLNHPRILTAHDFGEVEDGFLYIVMEYMTGGSLYERITAKRLSTNEALRIVAEVCEGLSFAHEKGIIHRDVKPSNILLAADGSAKLADFGLSKPTILAPESLERTTGNVFATREYAAPELLESGHADARSDIFSMGVVLYEALCFVLPRGQFTPVSANHGIDPRLDAIISKALQPDPERRYASAGEMLKDLRAVEQTPSTSVVALTQSNTKAPPSVSQRSWLIIGTVLLGLAAVVMIASSRPVNLNGKLVRDVQPSRSNELSTLPWHEWTLENSELPTGLIRSAEGLRLGNPKAAHVEKIYCGPQLGDQAVRVQYSVATPKSEGMIRPILRSSDDYGSYVSVLPFPKNWQVVRKSKEGLFEIARISRAPENLEVIHTVELSIAGEDILFTAEGKSHEAKYKRAPQSGRPGFVCSGNIIIHKIEWKGLPHQEPVP